MKYKNVITDLLTKIFRESWMGDSEWEEMLNIFIQNGVYEQLSSDIEVGISNGYSLEEQLLLVEKIFLK